MTDTPITPAWFKREFCETARNADAVEIFCEAASLDGRCVICQVADLWESALHAAARVEQEKEQELLAQARNFQAVIVGLDAQIVMLRGATRAAYLADFKRRFHARMKDRKPDYSCDCVYCRRDPDELEELASNYELDLHAAQTKVADLESQLLSTTEALEQVRQERDQLREPCYCCREQGAPARVCQNGCRCCPIEGRTEDRDDNA